MKILSLVGNWCCWKNHQAYSLYRTFTALHYCRYHANADRSRPGVHHVHRPKKWNSDLSQALIGYYSIFNIDLHHVLDDLEPGIHIRKEGIAWCMSTSPDKGDEEHRSLIARQALRPLARTREQPTAMSACQVKCQYHRFSCTCLIASLLSTFTFPYICARPTRSLSLCSIRTTSIKTP